MNTTELVINEAGLSTGSGSTTGMDPSLNDGQLGQREMMLGVQGDVLQPFRNLELESHPKQFLQLGGIKHGISDRVPHSPNVDMAKKPLQSLSDSASCE